MQLFINGLPAALPESMEFNYFTESRYFSDAGGYSLDIELPLAGCVANRRIFGHIERNPPDEAVWPARLVCDGIDQTGSALLLDVAISSVKVQFLSGRATSDYADLDTTYINEMDLPDRINTGDIATLSPADCMATYDRIRSAEYASVFAPDHSDNDDDKNWMEIPAVAPMWLNDQTGAFQNSCSAYGYMVWDVNREYYGPGKYPQSTRMTGLSWMPYLLPLAKAIAETAGYTVDFSRWEESDLRNLIVCNALPAGEFSRGSGDPSLSPQILYRCGRALPHWNVLEFFDNISPLLSGEFTFDHLAKTVRFDFSAEAIENRPEIRPTLVEDGYEITSNFGMEETEGNYLRALPWRYDDPGMELWKFMDCPWYDAKSSASSRQIWITPAEVMSMMYPWRNSVKSHCNLYYALEPAIWFCYYALHANRFILNPDNTGYTQIVPLALNLFGPERYDGPDAQYRTLSVLPAVTVGEYIHLSPEGCEDPTSQRFSTPDSGEDDEVEEPVTDINSEEYQTSAAEIVSSGEPEKTEGYYDHLFVGLWRGTDAGHWYAVPETAGFRYGWQVTRNESFSMRLNDGHAPYSGLPQIKESIKFTFYFHSRRFPDVNAIYNINGRRYLCRRLEATLTSRGMSRRIKGEFYPIQE